jgi:hypothetical protein
VAHEDAAETRAMSPKKRGSGKEEEKDAPAAAAAMVDDAVVDPTLLSDEVLQNRSGVKCFAEVRLQENTASTTTTEGTTPIWRQTLTLAFKNSQNDYSSAALAQIRDELIISLFDEVTEDDAHRGGFLEGESTLRTEKRFIGSLIVPLHTVLIDSRVEGTFRVGAPIANFGYSLRSQVHRRDKERKGGMFVGTAGDEVNNDIVAVRPNGWLPASLMGLFATAPKPDNGHGSDEHLSDSVLKEFGYFASGNSATFVSLMITLDPLLPPPPSTLVRSIDKLPPASFIARAPGGLGNEVALLAHARQWLIDISNVGPFTKKRNYMVFATDHTGHSVFIPRFLSSSMSLPPGFPNRRSLVHLVSLIPFMPDAQSFMGETDLWCTDKQTFEIGAGDEEEHAVLLYNFLAALKSADSESTRLTVYPAEDLVATETLFMVLGRALPEGDTVYIVLRDVSKGDKGYAAANFLVVNPCTGYIYSASDENCPLKQIYTLITPYNIWANIQPSDKPSDMDFNVLNASAWKPFYGTRFPFPSTGLPTVQSIMDYVPTSTAYCIEIETAIKNALKTNMRKWRSRRKRSITTFHPDASATIYDMLQYMENWKRTGITLVL